MSKIKPRMRHVLMAILGFAVLVSTVGSILETLDFNDINKPRPVSTPSVRKAWIEDFRLETASKPSDGIDANDATSIDVVQGRDITVSARVVGVRDVIVIAGINPHEATISVTGQPDANGDVSINLRLPQTNTVYLVQAYGIVKDKLRAGWPGGAYDNVPAVTVETPLRVMAK